MRDSLKSNIMILTDVLRGHGGEETVLQLFSKYLSDCYNLKLVIPLFKGDKSWLQNFNNNIVRYNDKDLKLLKLLLTIENLLDTKADIVICMTPKLIYLANIIKKFFRKKYSIISWQHFSIFRPTDKASLTDKKKWYSSADYYFAISSGIKKELTTLGIDQEKVYTIYNPIIPTNKVIVSNKKITHFLCVARIQLNEQKNLQELFDACSKVKGNWILDIYGNDDSEGMIETIKCKNYAQKLGILNHIIWHGWVNNVWAEDIQPSCLVMTSNFEGFPMSLCEAASHGIPLISADCPTGPADIVNEKNGFLYKMHDVEKLASFMQEFIDGKAVFDTVSVKKSVSKFYVNNYIINVQNSIEKIIGDKDE